MSAIMHNSKRPHANNNAMRQAWLATLVYVILASLWIVFSGNLIDLLPFSSETRADLEIYKGLLFVLVTAMLLYGLLRRGSRALPAEMAIDDAAVPPRSRPKDRWFVVAGIALSIVSLGLGYISYDFLKKLEYKKAEQQLTAVIEVKAEDIESRVRAQLQYAHVAGNFSALALAADEWSRHGQVTPSQKKFVDQRLLALQRGHTYTRVALLDIDGKPRAFVGETQRPASEEAIATLFHDAVQARKPVIGKIYWYFDQEDRRQMRHTVVAPLLPQGPDGKVVGGVLFELDPELRLIPLVTSWPIPSQTIETTLAVRDTGGVTFLTEQSQEKKTAPRYFTFDEHPEMLATQVARGTTGTPLKAQDHHGLPILGYGMAIPDTDLLILAKMDIEEVEKPARSAAARLALTLFLFLAVCALAIYFRWRQKDVQHQMAQQQAELQKQALIKHFDYLSKYANDIILLMDDDGTIVEVNDRAEAVYGKSRDALIGMHALKLRAPSETGQFAAQWEALKSATGLVYETRQVHENGLEFPVEVSSRRIETDHGAFVQHIIRDISERKSAEQRAERLQNMYHALGETTKAIMRLEDEAELFPLACRIAVEYGGMLLSWVGRPDPEGRYLIPATIYGQARDFIGGLKIPIATGTPESGGPASTAFRESRTIVIHDVLADPRTAPWHASGHQYDIRAAASFPVTRAGKPYAVFVVYNNQPYSFDEEIVALLTEVADSLSFALDNFDRESARQCGEASLRTSEARLRRITDESAFPMMVHAEDGEILQVNRAWLSISGYAREDIPTNKVWLEKAYGERAEAVWEHIQSVFQNEQRVDAGEFDLRCKDGSHRVWHFISTPLGRLPDGRRYIISTANDVTESKKAEKELRLAATVFESNKSCIYITDPEGTILSINPAFSEVTGYAQEEALGKTPRLLKSGRYGNEFYQSFWHALKTRGYWRGEMWNKRKNGEEYLAWLTVNAVQDAQGATVNYTAISEDITQIRADKTQIEFLANFDSLTRLPNRELAKDRLEQAMIQAGRAGSRVALIYLDLDNFRIINDTLGYHIGDELLKSIAERLHKCGRETDTVSRQAGDEFLLVLPGLSELESVNIVADKIIEQLAQPFDIDGTALSISCSMGIAIYPEDAKDGETLVKNADVAMYNAKRAGRNTFRFYAENMNAMFEELLHIRNDLVRAIEENQFLLHYQPQLDLASNTICGAEALIRWQHPEMGMVPPGRFIQVAEESGMISLIGEWVIREACRQAAAWQEAGLKKIVVAVNISPLQFRRGDLEQIVSSALAESGLDAQYLELELTESTLIQDVEKSLEAIERFDKLGLKMSIDDFGTGYSSLAYLQRLPVSKLKIDQSFIKNLTTEKSSEAITLSIISLAHALDKTVIAEGVEAKEQADFLVEHGCDEIQGYYFSRPIPPADFERLL
jgi:diguanylate cyclase (GGDEF)-like protein/PAS domain S-box-containing protein